MSQHSILILTARVHPGSEQNFAEWQTRLSDALSRSPGFVATDVLPPRTAGEAWTVIMNFDSEAAAETWKSSKARGSLLAEVAPLLDGGTFAETMSGGAGGMPPSTDVTEVIFSKVKPGMADRYREWAARIQAAQAQYPGYRGMYLQPPAEGKDGHWTSIIRYDSVEHLEAWMNAPERRELLSETSEFIESEEMLRLASAFPGWVPNDPLTGEPPPNWKAAMLVLLGLFPIVMLQMKFLGYLFIPLGIKNPSMATFIGNVISVSLTSFLTMPVFVRCFGWWLFPKGNKSAQTAKGVAILFALFAIEVIVLWNLIP